jgi:hypothetical protein
MNKVLVGCILTSVFTFVANAQVPVSLEERLKEMEQRLKITENKLPMRKQKFVS